MHGFLMARHRLTDEQWALIADLFAVASHTGRPPSHARQMIDGILWILRTGAPWRDLPTEFGSKSTVWDHFDRWNEDGTLVAVLDRLRDRVEINGELWCVDGTGVRAAKCAAGGGKKGILKNPTTTPSASAEAV
jgi:transposase